MKKFLIISFCLLFALPLISTFFIYSPSSDWKTASMESSNLIPKDEEYSGAIIQVYAARAFGWRGYFATHTWIAYRKGDQGEWTRWDVTGWGSGSTVKKNIAPPDGKWYGSQPILLKEVRGIAATSAIRQIENSIEEYPYQDQYTAWPGPNSNTFTAYVIRNASSINVDLPSNAIGKDYTTITNPLTRSPGGAGYNINLYGILGINFGFQEGFELNILSLNYGFDIIEPGILVPFWGKISF